MFLSSAHVTRYANIQGEFESRLLSFFSFIDELIEIKFSVCKSKLLIETHLQLLALFSFNGTMKVWDRNSQ